MPFLTLSSAFSGHAMRAGKDVAAGTVIGKALEKLEADEGEIEVVVMLR